MCSQRLSSRGPSNCFVLCMCQVAPKRAALKAAQDSLNGTLAALAEAQAKLAAVQDKIAALEAQFEEATKKKAALAAQVCAHRGSDLLSLPWLACEISCGWFVVLLAHVCRFSPVV